MPRLCEVYPGICLTIEENARKNLSQCKKKSVLSDFPTKILYVFLMSPIRVSYPAAHPITLNLTKAHVIKFKPRITSRQHPQPPAALACFYSRERFSLLRHFNQLYLPYYPAKQMCCPCRRQAPLKRRHACQNSKEP